MVGNKHGEAYKDSSFLFWEFLGYSTRKKYLDIINWKDRTENKRRHVQLEFAGQEIREKRAAPRRNAGDLQRFPFCRVLTRPWKFRLPEAKERATGGKSVCSSIKLRTVPALASQKRALGIHGIKEEYSERDE